MITNQDQMKVGPYEWIYKYADDLQFGMAATNQFVSNLNIFSTVDTQHMVIVDQIFAGFDFQGVVGNQELTLCLNVYDKSQLGTATGPGDSQVPKYKQEFALGFNSAADAAEAAKMLQKAYAYCRSNEILQVAIKRANSSPIATITNQSGHPVGGMSVQFRLREAPIYA